MQNVVISLGSGGGRDKKRILDPRIPALCMSAGYTGFTLNNDNKIIIIVIYPSILGMAVEPHSK